jgi:hypothetical protein
MQLIDLICLDRGFVGGLFELPEMEEDIGDGLIGGSQKGAISRHHVSADARFHFHGDSPNFKDMVFEFFGKFNGFCGEQESLAIAVSQVGQRAKGHQNGQDSNDDFLLGPG